MKPEKVIVFVLILILSGFSNSSYAAVSDWQQGASIGSRFTTDFESEEFRQSLRNLAATGANSVSLIIPIYQASIHSTDIGPGWNTPTDAALESAIDYAHSIGLRVILKPHLETYDGNWRAFINPSDRTRWFSAYESILSKYAAIGARKGAAEIVLATELISMSSEKENFSNTQNWRNLIANIRKVYSGKLTYSANWGSSGFADEVSNIKFWDALDAIGISAYFELTQDWNNSVDFLKSAWDEWNRTKIRPLHEQTGKPIIFTEIGYRSIGGAHTRPWDAGFWSYLDETEQANDYEALFSYWNDQPFMQGVSMWDWSSDPNAGGPGDGGYTPQHKKAEGVMKKWFGASATPPGTPPPPPPPGNPSFSDSTSASPGNPAVGQPSAIETRISNSGDPISGVTVDIEVYSSAGTKEFQRYFENENFAGGESKTYLANFTPTANGNFTVKVGAFSNNWSRLFFWNNSAAAITAGTAPTPPPPGTTPPPSSSTIDIWWPTDGSRLSGTQPFKAMLSGKSLSEYEMFWQVDGDTLNKMFDSMTDYPHKESLVDLSGWNWNGNGSYVLNFIAKNLGGGTIAERAATILTGQ